jgi:hypothetical protein
VNCSGLSMRPRECVGNPGCGFCESSSSCVRGTPSGPSEGCLAQAYRYTAPSDNWNPLNAGTINVQAIKDNKSQIIIAPTPDLEHAFLKP